MKSKRPDELERDIERALQPGSYIGYQEMADFIEFAEAIKTRITSLVLQEGMATRTVALLELFIAGCYEKSEEIDDSGDEFGRFVRDLFCGWIRARQAAGADSEETVKSLYAWIQNDDYGYCHDLEPQAVGSLDKGGLRALEQMAREIADASAKETYAHRRNIEVLKAIHVKRGDVRAYQALCEAEADMAPADCEKLAEMYLTRRKVEDALAWVERGLELEKTQTWSHRSAWRLPELKRKILMRLGRGEDALASAWEDYCRTPSIYSYADLMEFAPRGERRAWHLKALAALGDASLSTKSDLLVKTKEWGVLASLIESTPRENLIALSHYTTGPAARGLTKAHPLLAAKLDVAMALRILEAKKSKYYDAALKNLEQARKAMLRNGCADEWERLATEIRTIHRRKSGFIPYFEALAEGRLTREPSFSERARERWRKGSHGEGT
jgi:uncharacterized Zn finger protein